MFSVIIEAIASTIAEMISAKAVEKGQAKHPRLYGWISLIALLLIIAGCVWLGAYLIAQGVWPIAMLMFIIAAFILYITAVPVIRKARQAKK